MIGISIINTSKIKILILDFKNFLFTICDFNKQPIIRTIRDNINKITNKITAPTNE